MRYTWQQLTELVAIAIGLPVKYDTLEEVYIDSDGNTFDPVRDDADCFRLAVVRRVFMEPQEGYTQAMPHGSSVTTTEYDANYDDPLTAARIAICNAVLLSYQLQ